VILEHVRRDPKLNYRRQLLRRRPLHQLPSPIPNQVVMEGARSRNRMMKNQRTSWSASKTFLEGLGRARLNVRIAL
jgi:hypothetical protein